MSFFKAPAPVIPAPQPEAPAAPGAGRQRGLYIDRRPPRVVPQPPSAPKWDDPVVGGPLGRLFEVKVDGRVVGFFDERACWCVKKGREVLVTRGGPRQILRLLTADQKRLLRNAQLAARRQDLR